MNRQQQVTGVHFTYTASDFVVLEVAFDVDERELARLIDERNGRKRRKTLDSHTWPPECMERKLTILNPKP